GRQGSEGKAEIQNPSSSLDAVDDGLCQLLRARARRVGVCAGGLKKNGPHYQGAAGADRGRRATPLRRQDSGDERAVHQGRGARVLGRSIRSLGKDSDAFSRKIAVRGCNRAIYQTDNDLGSAGRLPHQTGKPHRVQWSSGRRIRREHGQYSTLFAKTLLPAWFVYNLC